jgi:sugar phosphate isomerase/epimerase
MIAMKTKKYRILFLAFLLFSVQGNSQGQKLDNTFYCFNNGVRDLPNAPQKLEDQAALIKKLGFDGLAGHATQNNSELRAALEKQDLMMPEIYYGMTMDEAGFITYPDELHAMIEDSKGKNLLVALTLNAKHLEGPNKKADKLFIEAIRKLASHAANFDVEIAIYPHVNLYCEASMHTLELASKVDRKNVGVVFNTCHFLKVEGEEGWEEKIEKSLPYLKMVSINGADGGDTQNMGWDQLIQPLGEGSFDTYKLVKFLKDNHYGGLFGLQCYGIKQDCKVALGKSIQTWKSYQKRYGSENP